MLHIEFPIQIDVLDQDTSRRIEDLVSPQCVRFKMTKSSAACNCADRSLPSHLTWVIHKPIDVGAAFSLSEIKKASDFAKFHPGASTYIGRACLQQSITK